MSDNKNTKPEATDNGNDNGNGNGNDNDKCPPGMKKDADGKCVPENGGESHRKEDTNAGDTTPKGTGTVTDASNVTEPAGNKKCPPGSTLGEDGECHPSGDPAGQVGGGGTGTAETPGKTEQIMLKTYEMMQTLMAQHSAYNDKRLEMYKNDSQKMLEALTARLGINPKMQKESAAFGVKFESSEVDDSGKDSVYDATVTQPAALFEAASKGLADNHNGFYTWKIKPEAYFGSLKKGWMNYGSGQAHGKLETAKMETFTITGGDMPQIFSKQVYLVPGGRMRVPIRQFLDTQIIEDADRYNWYTVNGFAFDDVTNEGSEPTTEESQTITKVTATPALVRANQTVNYADIENAPFDLIEAFNRAAALGALDAEGTDVLDTVYDAITPTNWVESDGTVITEDDTTDPQSAQQEMIYVGMQLIQDQGGDTSPGNMWAALHPKSLRELILDVTTEFWAGMGTGEQGAGISPRLMNTSMGVLENRLGVDIVATNQVHAQNNTTNDVFRNILAMKGVIGLAVAAELQIEAQRRPDLSAVKVGARHRIKGAIIDETMTARMSSAQ